MKASPWGIAGCAVAVVAVAGCATVNSRTYDSDEFVRMQITDTPPAEKPDIAAQWRFEGDELVVSLDRYWSCTRQQVRVFHRTRVTENRLANNGAGIVVYGLAGSVLTPYGAYCVTSGTACDYTTTNDKGEEEKTHGDRIGMVMLGAGLFMLGVAAVDAYHELDDSEDMGEFERSVGEGEPYSCREDTGQGTPVTLTLPGGAGSVPAVAGADGVARFKLSEFEELVALGTVAELQIGERTESVSLLGCESFRIAFAKVRDVQPYGGQP